VEALVTQLAGEVDLTLALTGGSSARAVERSAVAEAP
jgi:hypothetical protein